MVTSVETPENGCLPAPERVGFSNPGLTSSTAPNGTVHSFDYDELGRQTQHRVTAFASDVDDAIKRIARSFDNRGQLTNVIGGRFLIGG